MVAHTRTTKPHADSDTVAARRRRFEELTLPHLNRLYRYALRLSGGRAAEAEDLVQETYLKAWGAMTQTELSGDGRPWLFRILTNLFINRYRRRRREPRVMDLSQEKAYIGANAAFDRAPPEDAIPALGEQLDERVKAALDSLSPEFRSVLLLAAVEELSYEEIARICGIPIGTVMSRLHRSRLQLRERLHEYAVEMRLEKN